MFYTLKGGQVYPISIFCALMAPSYSHSGIFCIVEIHVQSNSLCTGMAKGAWGGVRTSSGLRISRRAYLKRLSPAPSSHCGRWMLILCAGTLDPRMHRCVARTKVMAILILTYPHFL